MRKHNSSNRTLVLICLLAFLFLLTLFATVLFPQGLSLGVPDNANEFFQQARSDDLFNNHLVFRSKDKLAVGDQLLMMDGPFINLYGAGHSPQRILNTAKLHTYIDQLYCLWPHLYFSNWSSETATLYDYHLETQELKELCQVPSCRFWAVSGNAFIYIFPCILDDIFESSAAVRDKLIPSMEKLRGFVDAAEMLTSAKYWPYPSYGKLLFSVY